MGSKHLKRIATPVTYRIPRKIHKFAPRVLPGPHGADEAVPVAILLRDILNIARNIREVKYILRKGYLKVDGKIIKDYRFPIGLMDVIELVPTHEYFRVVPSKRYLIDLVKITSDEASIKLCQIKRKVMVKGGAIQMTGHDGRNFLFNMEDEMAKLKPGDVIIYDIDKNNVAGHIRFKKGNIAIITRGAKMGYLGIIEDVIKPHPLRPRMARIAVNDNILETLFEYVFPVGEGKPIIKLHE